MQVVSNWQSTKSTKTSPVKRVLYPFCNHKNNYYLYDTCKQHAKRKRPSFFPCLCRTMLVSLSIGCGLRDDRHCYKIYHHPFVSSSLTPLFTFLFAIRITCHRSISALHHINSSADFLHGASGCSYQMQSVWTVMCSFLLQSLWCSLASCSSRLLSRLLLGGSLRLTTKRKSTRDLSIQFFKIYRPKVNSRYNNCIKMLTSYLTFPPLRRSLCLVELEKLVCQIT